MSLFERQRCPPVECPSFTSVAGSENNAVTVGHQVVLRLRIPDTNSVRGTIAFAANETHPLQVAQELGDLAGQ